MPFTQTPQITHSLMLLFQALKQWFKTNILKVAVNLLLLIFSTPLIFDLPWMLWIKILIFMVGCFVIVILQNRIQEQELVGVRAELDFQYEVTFNLSAQAIYDMSEVVVNAKTLDYSYLKQLLLYFEKSVIGILEANSMQVGRIGVNLMLPKEDTLVLYLFGLDLPFRKHVQLPCDCNNPLPGAPEAKTSRKIQYVQDTTNKQIKVYFQNKAYKSFLSIPIFKNEIEEEGEVIAVLNIDSTMKKQFGSMKFVMMKVYPALKPLLTTIQVLHNNDKIVLKELGGVIYGPTKN
ncbi:MAG: hypothetical protein WBI14_10145 [Anaerolineaceae bacterium]